MKEYLKMSDVFDCEVESDADLMLSDSLGGIADFSGYKTQCRYSAHAINSHDGLVAEVERLRARVAELEEFTYHFCDNSYNVDLSGGDCTAATCEAKDMAHKLDNRVLPDLWPGH